MNITKTFFDNTSNGQAVDAYTMTNDHGAYVTILTRGGIIQEIVVPDKNGELKNISIGFDDMKGYESCTGFIGAAIGRSSGRISGAVLRIDDKEYPLAKNDGNNNLHGGPNAFDKVIWEASELCSDDKMSVVLHYLSPDMEEGFPGNLDCTMTYSFDNSNTLTIKYTCTTDIKTFVNLTNHCYFNLSGDFSTKASDHLLQIKADRYVTVDSETIPTGLLSVEGTPFDFRTPKPIQQDIESLDEQLQFAGGYDHAFELNQPSSEALIYAKDTKTGRTLQIKTDAACVVFYSGNYLVDSYIASGNIPLQKRAAFCLETQYYPDAINAPFVKDNFLEPNAIYRTSTSYTFGVDRD
ncbi:MAG: galactose mutarotase [Vallitaleaceae bacterium]|nr:galactose mutarotase [Vallitaleaceae bacterium]